MEVEIDILQYLKQIEEENKGRSASKVSKIATMFQFPCENDDRDEKDGSGPTVTVVRTESHVARFNTARALFEKMAEKKSEDSKSSTKVVTHQRRTCAAQLVGHHSSRSTPSPAYRKASSRSPSPASSHSIHHQPNGHHTSNSFKSSNPTSISTITSSYTPTPSSFHSSIQNPSIPSVLPLSVRSTLDSDVYKDKHHHHHPLNADVRISNVDVRNNPKDESHTSGRDLIGTGNRYINNEFVDEGYNDNLNRKHEHSAGRKIETKNRPNSLIKPDKPAKPETLIDKPLSSHLQNQQIIQRHKNWFQSFSKTKSPLTSPQKPHEPTSPSFRTANVYEQRSQCEEPPSVHNDWRKERSAILKGSGRNNRQEVEVKNPSDVNVKSFEDVSTLPSCWSPPKQYNELSTSKGDKDSGYSSSAVLSTPGEDYRRDPSPSHVDRNEVESKTYIITDISKDSKSLNRERKHNHGDAHDTKHIAGVFKKGNETMGSSEGGRSSSTSVSKVANRSSLVDDDNALRQSGVVLRHRDDLPTDKELRLKEWEKRLSQRDSFHEGTGERIVADISSSSSSGSRVERNQFRDSTLERRERKRLEEDHDNKRIDAEKNRKDVRKMEENSVQQRISGDEEREIRKRKLQIEKERLIKDEEERSRLRKEERRERLRKEDHREEERDRLAREEQGKERLIKEHDERDRMREIEEQERRNMEEKREGFRREEEKGESFRREEEKRASLRREMERKEKKRESLRREKEKQERIRREEENEKLRREDEERERLRREELEREMIQREEEEREILRREEEERETLRREKEERERLRREKEERERLRREKEERDRLRMEEREKLRREEEERERLRREEEEKERLRREEEMERLRREKEERAKLKREKEERERLKREEEERERLRREEEERKRLKREEKERERLKREEEERERLTKEEEERERLKREDEERERLRREEEEREKLRRVEEEKEKLRREEEEKERLKREEEERRMEKEKLRREEEEKERLRREMKEKEKLRKEKEERERLRKEDEEREKLRREKEEEERLKLEEELMERLRKEKEESERLKREEKEIEMLRRKEEERLWREEKERERLRKEALEKERLRREAEERERIRMEEEERERLRKETAEKDRLKKEAEERLRREDEERERLRQEEIKRREEMEREKLRKAEEERELLRREEEREKIREAEEKEEIERKWHAKREKLEEEERIRREKDRVEIEKTKKRIAELKKERDEIQRQQAMRLRMLMKDETGETDQDIDQFRDASPDDEEVVEELAEVHYPVRTLPGPRTSVHSSPSKDTVKTTHELITSESQSRNETSPTNVEEVETISNLPLPMTQSSEHITEGLVQNQDDIAYDLTVLSAQHKLEFCTSSYNDSICKKSEEKDGTPQLDQFSSSTLSSEFEPLPPPVPPHNVDPATLAATACVDQQRLPPLPIDSELPEPMTPEEAEKLLSHNIIEMKKGLLAEAGELESSRATGSAQPPFSLEEEICRQEVDTEKSTKPEQDDPFDKDYDSVCVDSPTPDNEDDGDDSYGYFKHELTEDGFVVRAKEVLSEDGVHYLEDGHFWIQVPGLAEEDDDDLPESVPVHQHTKLKFSKDPIKLFSTFSVSDYDRRNDDVDPVAASAEYELEKRVEKMNVFPVCIEKGEGGLGLSIIGMGVGADAGVEKLGIFVKTITPGGATANDGMIQVNDQIIEVDNQSLVGVTQMFAASVLKNTSGTVNFLIGRENDPENSEVAMLIRQSLLADQERDERRRALEGPNYDPRNSTGIFESFSSQSGGDSPSEDTPRNSYIQQRDVGHPDQHLYGGQEFGDQYGDIYGSCSSSPPEGASSTPPEAFNHDVEGRELLLQNNEMIIMSQHLQEIQHRNDMYEEEITILRNKIGELEKDLGSTTDMARKIQETTKKLKEVEDTLQARQAEIATYQDMLEQSQGQYIILEKKYYKAKKIIKEYQSRERDFLHREEYHITQLEEKDALYNSLVKALKDRVIQLEGDLIKAQQEAGLPVKLPPDLNSQSSNFVHSKGQDNQCSLQKNPPRKPSTINSLDADLSDTEAGDTHTSEGSKCSTVERKIPSKEELDVAVPPTELLDNSFSKAKGELASRGGLANRQLPSLKKSSSNASANSFEHSFDDVVDDGLPESQHQLQVTSSSSVQSKSTSSTTTFHSEESIIHSSSSTSVTSTAVGTQSSAQGNVVYGSRTQPPPPYQATHSQSNQTPAHPPSPHHQPPPYQPPPSAPLSYRPGMPSDPQSGRSEAPYRHPPPIARVQPVNRVEAVPSPLSLNNQQHQQTLAHQLKALLAEREGNSEAMQEGNKEHTAMKKSPSSLMEDVRRAVIQADMSIGKKPVISGPIHVSSTAQVVSTGQFVHNRTSPQKAANVGAAFQQKINRDSGSWSPVINASNSPVGGGVVLLSQRPIDSSLPVAQSNEAGDGLARKELVSHDSTSSFDAQSLDRFPIGRPPKEILSVFDWTKEQVAQWLVVQGLENYVSTFVSAGITGPRLINIDTKDLKNLGLSSDDKTRIKKKVKELRQNLEKERKQMEKENKEREKLQRKAEKLAEKAERRKK